LDKLYTIAVNLTLKSIQDCQQKC